MAHILNWSVVPGQFRWLLSFGCAEERHVVARADLYWDQNLLHSQPLSRGMLKNL